MKLAEAPHRSFFFVGGVLALLALFQWAHTLLSRIWPGLAVDSLLLTAGHAFYMLYFFFAPFMFGFIFTAGPRWLSVAGPGRHVYVPVAILQGVGGVLFLSGLLPGVGLALLDLAWLMACAQWWQLVWQSPAEDKRHAVSVAVAFTLAATGAVLGTVIWQSGDLQWWPLVAAVGMWGFLVPVFLTVSHRMVPFFTGAVLAGYQPWRPVYLLPTWWGAATLLGAGEALSVPGVRLAGALVLLVSLAITLYHWQPWRTLQTPLLAMLHLAFAWGFIAAAFYGAGALQDLAGVSNGLSILGRHAMTLGFFLCMMMGFVTRVSLGHSGRPLAVDAHLWRLYLGLHGVAIGRLVLAGTPEALAMVAVVATLVLAGWLIRFLPLWWQPRVDGQLG